MVEGEKSTETKHAERDRGENKKSMRSPGAASEASEGRPEWAWPAEMSLRLDASRPSFLPSVWLVPRRETRRVPGVRTLLGTSSRKTIAVSLRAAHETKGLPPPPASPRLASPPACCARRSPQGTWKRWMGFSTMRRRRRCCSLETERDIFTDKGRRGGGGRGGHGGVDYLVVAMVNGVGGFYAREGRNDAHLS